MSYGVSVTCEVSPGSRRWFLTRESGRLPRKCESVRLCSTCSSWSDGEEAVLRVPYLVVKVTWHAECAILVSSLGVDAVSDVARRLVPLLERCVEGRRWSELATLLDSSRWRDGDPCLLRDPMARGLSAAGAISRDGRARWLRCDTFRGVGAEPPNSPMFFGVTDAMGGISPDGGRPWLLCSEVDWPRSVYPSPTRESGAPRAARGR